MILSERQPRETMRDYARRIIKDNIIRLELAPGTMLSEKDLADELGASRTPVREALVELSKVNIVDIYPQRGSCIALIDYALVEEARFLRNVLECAVAKEVCMTADEQQIIALEDILSLQEFYFEKDLPDKLFEQDDAFHRMLFRIANKMHTHELMDGFTIHFDRVRSLSLSAERDIKIVEDHRAILEAIKKRDPERVCEVMEKHLSRYKVDKVKIQQQFPQYFK